MTMNWKLLSASLLGIFLVACDGKKEDEQKTEDAAAPVATAEEPKAEEAAAPAADAAATPAADAAAAPVEAPKE